MSAILSFKSIESKHDVYRGKDWMKKFCESVKHDVYRGKDWMKKFCESVREHVAQISKCKNLLYL